MQRLLVLVALVVCVSFGIVGSSRADIAPGPWRHGPPLRPPSMGLVLDVVPGGARVVRVERDQIADHWGLHSGDLIIAIDRKYVPAMSRQAVRAFANGQTTLPDEILYVRDGLTVMETGPRRGR